MSFTKKLRLAAGRRLLLLCLLLSVGGAACRTSLFAESLDYIQPFSLKPLNEGFQLGLGAALSGSALVFDKFIDFKKIMLVLAFSSVL